MTSPEIETPSFLCEFPMIKNAACLEEDKFWQRPKAASSIAISKLIWIMQFNRKKMINTSQL